MQTVQQVIKATQQWADDHVVPRESPDQPSKSTDSSDQSQVTTTEQNEVADEAENSGQQTRQPQSPTAKQNGTFQAKCECPQSLLPTRCKIMEKIVPKCEFSGSFPDPNRNNQWVLPLFGDPPVGCGGYLALVTPLPGTDEQQGEEVCALLVDGAVVHNQLTNTYQLVVDITRGKRSALACCKVPEGFKSKKCILFLRALSPNFQRPDCNKSSGGVSTCWPENDVPCFLQASSESSEQYPLQILYNDGKDVDGQTLLFPPCPKNECMCDQPNELETKCDNAFVGNLKNLDKSSLRKSDDSESVTTLLFDVFAKMTGTFPVLSSEEKKEYREQVVACMFQFGTLEHGTESEGGEGVKYRRQTYVDFQHFRLLVDILSLEVSRLVNFAKGGLKEFSARMVTAKLPTGEHDEKKCEVSRLVKLYFKDRKSRKSGKRNDYFASILLHTIMLCRSMHKSQLAKATARSYLQQACTWVKDDELKKLLSNMATTHE